MDYEVVEYDWEECGHVVNDDNRQVIASGMFVTPVVDSKTGERVFKVFIEKAVRAKMTEAQYKAALYHEEGHLKFDREVLLNSKVGLVVDMEMEKRADRYAIERGAKPQDLFEAVVIIMVFFYKRMGLTSEQAKAEGENVIRRMLTYPYYKDVKA